MWVMTIAWDNRSVLASQHPPPTRPALQNEARVQLVAVLDAPLWRGTALCCAPAATAAASMQPELLLCCTSSEVQLAKQAAVAGFSGAAAAAAAETATAAAAADTAQHYAAAVLLQRVQRAASLPSPAKRTRLQGPAASELLRASPFAAVAAQQPQQPPQQQLMQLQQRQRASPQAMASASAGRAKEELAQATWWLQQPVADPASVLAHAVVQLSRAASLEGTPECGPAGPAPPSATGTGSSGRASLCLSSRSFASEASGMSTGFNGSQTLPSATSVLPSVPPPQASASAAPAVPLGALPAAFAHPSPPQQQQAQQQWQWQAQMPFAQQQQQQQAQQAQQWQQQQQQGELYWQRLHAIKAERAYPVVVELPHVQPALASEQGVAAALSSLLRLLSKRKGE